MKKMAIAAMVAVLIMGLGIGSASAASSSSSLQAGSLGFNVGFGDSALGANGVVNVSGRYFIMNDMAIQAGVGLQTSSGDLDADYFSTSVGARKYFRTDDFAPFVEGKFSYVKEKVSAKFVDTTTIDFSGNFGAEYFLHRQFSIEGSVGVGFGTVKENATSQDYTYFGTHTVGISANFYF